MKNMMNLILESKQVQQNDFFSIDNAERKEGAEAAFAEAGLHFESLLTRSDIVNL